MNKQTNASYIRTCIVLFDSYSAPVQWSDFSMKKDKSMF